MEVSLLYAHYFYYRQHILPGKVLSVLDSLKKEAIQRKKVWAEALAENMAALYNFNKLQHYEVAFEHHHVCITLLRIFLPTNFRISRTACTRWRMSTIFLMILKNPSGITGWRCRPSRRLNCIRRLYVLSFSIHWGFLTRNWAGLIHRTIILAKRMHWPLKKTMMPGRVSAAVILGTMHFLRRQFDIAVPLLEKDVTIALKYTDWGLASGSLMVLGDISLQQGNISKADHQLSEARQYVYRSGQYQRLQVLYPLLSKLYAAKGKCRVGHYSTLILPCM
jgi:hypothetical protein